MYCACVVFFGSLYKNFCLLLVISVSVNYRFLFSDPSGFKFCGWQVRVLIERIICLSGVVVVVLGRFGICVNVVFCFVVLGFFLSFFFFFSQNESNVLVSGAVFAPLGLFYVILCMRISTGLTSLYIHACTHICIILSPPSSLYLNFLGQGGRDCKHSQRGWLLCEEWVCVCVCVL
jgi:hypothetical protein